MTAWTRAALEALGPVTDVSTTAEVCGVNSDTVYAAIRRGEWTLTRVLRIGRKIKIPTRDLIALLYAPELDVVPATQPSPAVPAPCQPSTFPQITARESQSQCGCGVGESAVVRPLRGA